MSEALSGGALDDTTVEQVVRLVESLDRSTFDFMEVQVGELKVTIGKGEPPAPAAAAPPLTAPTQLPAQAPAPAVQAPAPVQAPAAPAPAAPQPAAPQPAAAQPAQPAPAAPSAPGSDLVEITAPTMGIFYAQPEPGKPPYVTVGDVVDEGTTVALIEVMKTFHAVPAGVRGTIAEICVNDAELVEFGAPLFRVRPEATA